MINKIFKNLFSSRDFECLSQKQTTSIKKIILKVPWFLLAIASQCSLLCGMPTTTTTATTATTTVRFSSLGYRVLIGCDKSCDIRIIDDIIVSCQQGQRIQYV